MRFAFLLVFILPALAYSAEVPKNAVLVESFLAQIGKDPVMLTDLNKYRDVTGVLTCAGVVKQEKELPSETKPLLENYIEDELMYFEAKAKKISSAGLILGAVHSIQKDEKCKIMWQKLGEKYGKYWKTPNHTREGEVILVRELEKRLLIDRFRKSEVISDPELWKRETRAKYSVKVLID